MDGGAVGVGLRDAYVAEDEVGLGGVGLVDQEDVLAGDGLERGDFDLGGGGAGPGAEEGFELGFHVGGLEVADYGEDGVAGGVDLFIKGHNIVPRNCCEGGLGGFELFRVGVAGVEGGEEVRGDCGLGVVFAGAEALLALGDGFLQLVFREGGMEDGVGEDGEGFVGVFGEEVGGDVGFVVGRGCAASATASATTAAAELHADEVDLGGHLGGGAGGRAAAEELLRDGGDAGLAVGVHEGAGAEDEGDGGEGQVVFFDEEDDEAVGELDVSGFGELVGVRLLRGEG